MFSFYIRMRGKIHCEASVGPGGPMGTENKICLCRHIPAHPLSTAYDLKISLFTVR